MWSMQNWVDIIDLMRMLLTLIWRVPCFRPRLSVSLLLKSNTRSPTSFLASQNVVLLHAHTPGGRKKFSLLRTTIRQLFCSASIHQKTPFMANKVDLYLLVLTSRFKSKDVFSNQDDIYFPLRPMSICQPLECCDISISHRCHDLPAW